MSTPGNEVAPPKEPRRVAPASSYGLVLLLIVISYVLAITIESITGKAFVLLIQVATVWFALRTSGARRAVRRIADVVLILALAIVLGALVDIFPVKASVPLVLFASTVLYFIAPLSILRDLVMRKKIDAEALLGTLSAYLLIGLCFGFAYLTMGAIQSAPFFGSQGDGTTSQALFFSFTTMTTTGYGNLVPAAQPGQSIAVLEMLMGQLFLATAIAKVITLWRPRRAGERETGSE